MRAIVHVGPWKTGTTSIQTMLGRAREGLAQAGIDYSPDFGDAHALLANSLQETPDPSLPPPRDARTSIDRPHTLIVSSESLCVADPAKVAAWGSSIHAQQVDVIAGAREPMGWMVSLYFEHARLQPQPFDDFIRERTEAGHLLVSSLIRRWQPVDPRWQFLALGRTTDATRAFADLAGIADVPAVAAAMGTRDNVTPSMPEGMYTALLTARSAEYSRAMTGVAQPSGRAASEFLHALLSQARPVGEYAAARPVSDLIDAGAVAPEPCEALVRWRESWIADAREAAGSLGEDGEALREFLQHLDSVPHRRLWPTPHFLDALPIDAHFEVLARTVAVAQGACTAG